MDKVFNPLSSMIIADTTFNHPDDRSFRGLEEVMFTGQLYPETAMKDAEHTLEKFRFEYATGLVMRIVLSDKGSLDTKNLEKEVLQSHDVIFSESAQILPVHSAIENLLRLEVLEIKHGLVKEKDKSVTEKWNATAQEYQSIINMLKTDIPPELLKSKLGNQEVIDHIVQEIQDKEAASQIEMKGMATSLVSEKLNDFQNYIEKNFQQKGASLTEEDLKNLINRYTTTKAGKADALGIDLTNEVTKIEASRYER